ncbi:MAG: EpsI family protein [Candidatus Zixiibacteriota bacterium]|nr:MAG: EpsI family protein [candidate division Zixibacteria bacterium]
MVKKTFVIFLLVQILVFLFGFAIKRFQPDVSNVVNIDDFPLEKDGWIGARDDLIPEMVEMLNPSVIFSATYTNREGVPVHLFFDYFRGQSNPGGPHSPRNCVPGSGWTILEETEREIKIDNRFIEIGSFNINRGGSTMIMDFWYITRYGETANDYIFKLYSMISSLTFKPNDVAFVRIIYNGDEEDLRFLDEFENLFVEEIYRHLNFEL